MDKDGPSALSQGPSVWSARYKDSRSRIAKHVSNCRGRSRGLHDRSRGGQEWPATQSPWSHCPQDHL